jgi:ferritin-like metal-binding protein YciE
MGIFNITLTSLRDLYLQELRDLYSAETQLLEALPEMAEAASAGDLENAFREHLVLTEGHVGRLKEIFEELGEKPTGHTCEAMKGLIKEGQEYVKAGGNDDVRDAALIGAAQRVEHYEMAGYGTARAIARRLGEHQQAELLQLTLDEEASADEILTDIAEAHVNSDASIA